jgi:hypothetical protein
MISESEIDDMKKTKAEMKRLYFIHNMPWRDGVDKWENQGYPAWWDDAEFD